MQTTTARARDRYVGVAARLFATRGYAGTSIADIQVACGVTPGSGALYKHFASKQALLEAVVDHHVETMRTGHEDFATSLPGDPRAALEQTARLVVEALQRDTQALRVMLRDLDEAPDLRDRMLAELGAHVYGPFVAWVHEGVAAGRLRAADPLAVATMLMSALTSTEVLHALLGQRPGDLDADRLAAAWVEVAAAALGVG